MITAKKPKKESLEEISLDSNNTHETIDLMEMQRKNFRFHKDFDFDDKEFQELTLKLYGRDNFRGYSFSQLKKRRKAKIEYDSKCKDYLVEQYHWPEKLAIPASRMIGLPTAKDISTPLRKAKYYFGTGIFAYFAGNLSERYVKPMAKLSNRDESLTTRLSIWTDIFSLGAATATVCGLNFLDSHSLENMYQALHLGKEVLTWAIYANMATRFTQIFWRTYMYKVEKKHTFSPATIINPNLAQIPIMTYFFAYDRRQTKLENKMKEEQNAEIILDKISNAGEKIYLNNEFAVAAVTKDLPLPNAKAI